MMHGRKIRLVNDNCELIPSRKIIVPARHRGPLRSDSWSGATIRNGANMDFVGRRFAMTIIAKS
jgi:hypothetical protein